MHSDARDASPKLRHVAKELAEMSYSDRVEAAFSTNGKSDVENRSDAIEYLKALRDTWKDISASLNRTLFIMLGLAAIFELIIASGSKQVNVAGFVFDDLTIIQVALPTLVAYLYLEVMISWMRYDDMFSIHMKVTRIAFPSIESNDLDVPLSPPSLALVRGAQIARLGLPARLRWVSIPISTLALVTLLLPLGFEIHAFYVIFKTSGHTLLNWIGLSITLALVVATLITFIISTGGDESVPDKEAEASAA